MPAAMLQPAYRTLNGRGRALVELGSWLRTRGYSFVTPTPETHRRINARAGNARARDLRGVFGWSRPFDPEMLPRNVLGFLREAGALAEHGQLVRSRVRFSTLEGELFAHSAYPTHGEDSVFFGPDTHRFVRFVNAELARLPSGHTLRVADVGCGSGAAGIIVARRLGARVSRMILADVNEEALTFAAVNAALAELTCECVQSDVLAKLEGEFDLLIANPPYMQDADSRTYRDGGAGHGSELSVRIVREGLDRLQPGGTLLLYTGAAIVDGTDVLRAQLEPVLRARNVTPRYLEIDPDVFGEELEEPAYADVERIAAVGLVAQRQAPTQPNERS
jgi:methylase of polypeptide subunit release factors